MNIGCRFRSFVILGDLKDFGWSFFIFLTILLSSPINHHDARRVTISLEDPRLSAFVGLYVAGGLISCWRDTLRKVGRALTELEIALTEAGVEENSVAEFVDEVEDQALELVKSAREEETSSDGDESE